MRSELLRTPAPALPLPTILAGVRRLYGIRAIGAETLGSERDQLLRLDVAAGDPVVLKISNPAEDPATLDMENGALAHLAAVDPTLPVPRLVSTVDGDRTGSLEGHLVRVLTVVPGRHIEGRPVSTRLAERVGAVAARVSVGLRGYFHPAAGRELDWDIRLQRDTGDRPEVRGRIRPALAALAALPAGVQHGDITLTNILADEAGTVTGVVDLGDMHHTAAVCDLVAALTSVLRNTSPVRPASTWELAAAFLDGYQRVRPLLAEEAALLGHLVLARLLTTVDISRERAAEHPGNREYIAQYDAANDRLLDELSPLDDHELALRFSRLAGLPVPSPAASASLGVRRDLVLGGRLAPLFYAEPLPVVSGAGPWLVSDEGTAYLDAYNNVAVAGHTHPAVDQAVVRQLRTLNTNSRYLNPSIVELAERLTATMPDGLDTVVFVTSGSEAVDLAWRMARAYTGRGGTLIAEWAYHGISTRTIDFSSNEWRGAGLSPVDVTTYRAPHEDQPRPDLAAPLAELERRGHPAGLLIADPQFTSEGILDAPPAYMRALVDGIHEAGGLFLADEVQSGFGRSGPALWRFVTLGITPDLVTLGKPMAAGLPVGAVVTRREIADAFPYEYFSTFAGGPLAGAAGCAVLDTLADRRIPERAVEVGEFLRSGLSELAAEFPIIHAVRGTGLIAGVDLRGSVHGGGPAFAARVVEGLRERRVLAGRTGPRGDVLKVRPPLVWTTDEASLFVAALRAVLQDPAHR